MDCGTRGRGLALAVFVLLGVGLGRGRADILLETADYTNALTPAYIVGANQFVGARFHVSGTVAVDHIGAHFVRSDGGQLFGALVSLSGSPAFPAGTPGNFNPIAETTFSVPNKAGDFLTGLSATLGPGDYALVFGSGRFGATGGAALAGGDTDKGTPSTFYSSTSNWVNNPLTGSRFLVTGQAQVSLDGEGVGDRPSDSPEPATLALAGIGLVCWRLFYAPGTFSLLACIRQRKGQQRRRAWRNGRRPGGDPAHPRWRCGFVPCARRALPGLAPLLHRQPHR
jgi:hypothetical protein